MRPWFRRTEGTGQPRFASCCTLAYCGLRRDRPAVRSGQPEPQETRRDLQYPCPVRELAQVLDRQSVLDTAELRLRQPEPAGDQFLGQRALAMMRMMPVGADHLADVPGTQGLAHEAGVPEARSCVRRAQREASGLLLAGSALGQAAGGQANAARVAVAHVSGSAHRVYPAISSTCCRARKSRPAYPHVPAGLCGLCIGLCDLRPSFRAEAGGSVVAEIARRAAVASGQTAKATLLHARPIHSPPGTGGSTAG